MQHFSYNTKIGLIDIVEDNGYIVNILFGIKENDYIYMETSLIKETYNQIIEYLNGERKQFNIPIKYNGTSFQEEVWASLLTIPYGLTRTYQSIAKQIGNPESCRAVGMACNANPLPIIIPCHRVIGKNGKLIGFGGGLNIKKNLLDIERSDNNV